MKGYRMKSRSLLLAAATSAILLSSASIAHALQAPPPANQAIAGADTAQVKEVNGIVQVRKTENDKWENAAVGMTLPVSAECRTGPKSSITFTLPHNQIVTLDRLGLMKILDSTGSDKSFKTDLGMKYGRIRYEVEEHGVQHQATIRTPSSALAVNGSKVVITDDGLGNKVTVEQGAGVYHPTLTDQTYVMGSDPASNYGPNPLQSTPGTPPAQTYFNQAATPYFDATSLTGYEQSVVSTNYTVGGLNTGVLTGVNPSGTNSDRLITSTLIDQNLGPGDLKFILTWNPVNPPQKGKPTDGGDGGNPTPPSFADLNIFVISPTGNHITPKESPTFSKKPGQASVSRDNHGAFVLGTETISWHHFWPVGLYQYGVHYAAGTDPAVFTIKVTLNNKQINPVFHDTVSSIDRDVRFSIDLPPKSGIPPHQPSRLATVARPTFDTAPRAGTMGRTRP
jgi:hypothetical protein